MSNLSTLLLFLCSCIASCVLLVNAHEEEYCVGPFDSLDLTYNMKRCSDSTNSQVEGKCEDHLYDSCMNYGDASNVARIDCRNQDDHMVYGGDVTGFGQQIVTATIPNSQTGGDTKLKCDISTPHSNMLCQTIEIDIFGPAKKLNDENPLIINESFGSLTLQSCSSKEAMPEPEIESEPQPIIQITSHKKHHKHSHTKHNQEQQQQQQPMQEEPLQQGQDQQQGQYLPDVDTKCVGPFNNLEFVYVLRDCNVGGGNDGNMKNYQTDDQCINNDNDYGECFTDNTDRVHVECVVTHPRDVVVWSGEVRNIGGEGHEEDLINIPLDDFDDTIECTISSSTSGKLCQTIVFDVFGPSQTDDRNPLYLGDQYGSMTLNKCYSQTPEDAE